MILSVVFVRETHGHARHEATLRDGTRDARAAPSGVAGDPRRPSFGQIILFTSWKNRDLFAASQAGLVNNLNDGMAWGLHPIFFVAAGLPLTEIAVLAAIYPAVLGIGQIAAGALSDRLGRKGLIVGGMWVQAGGIATTVLTRRFDLWIVGMALLGAGTALVYPTLLAVVSDVTPPQWRASTVGVDRLWRDSGYAVGALLAGVLADRFGLSWSITSIGVLTFASDALALARMQETLPKGRTTV